MDTLNTSVNENLNMNKLMNLFLINSEILLRASSKNLEIGTTCTSGYMQPLCKSYYSTRCALTVDVFNAFFAKRILYYLTKRNEKYKEYSNFSNNIKNIIDNFPDGFSLSQNITNPSFIDFVAQNTFDSIDALNQLYDDFLKQFDILNNVIITLEFNTVPFYDASRDENLVGHIYNLIVNNNKYYLIQSYMYKYSPVCIEITKDEFNDYLLSYYMITKNPIYIIDEPSLTYQYFIDNNIRSMYFMFNGGLYLNPWFNELFFKCFQDYYYYPYDLSGMKIFAISEYENRPYLSTSLAIYELNDNYLTYYNILNFLYNYYNIIAYDIYAYKNYLSDSSKTFLVNRNNVTDFNEKINPTYYRQTIDDDMGRHKMISFWENNFYIQLSSILSDFNLLSIDDSDQYGRFIFDIYQTFLFSSKNSILYTHTISNSIFCGRSSLIEEIDKYNLLQKSVKLKFIINNFNIDSSLISDSYLPIFNLFSSLDMYDYYNTQSCIIFDFLSQITYTIIENFENEELSILINKYTKNIENIDEETLNDKQLRFYYYAFICNEDYSSGIMDPNDDTKYNNYKINALINIIMICFSFFILERAIYNVKTYFDEFFDPSYFDEKTTIMNYIDFVKLYYQYNDASIDQSLYDIFIFIYLEIKSIYDNDYITNEIFSLESFVKSGNDYMDFILYYVSKTNYIDLDDSSSYNYSQKTRYNELSSLIKNISNSITKITPSPITPIDWSNDDLVDFGDFEF